MDLLRIREQLAAAELKRLQEESDSDDDLDTIASGPDDAARVENWVLNSTTVLAIANEPHEVTEPNHVPTLEPSRAAPSAQPTEERTLKTGAPAAPLTPPVAIPATAAKIVQGWPATTGVNGATHNSNSTPDFSDKNRKNPLDCSDKNRNNPLDCSDNPTGWNGTGVPVTQRYESAIYNSEALQSGTSYPGAPAPAGVIAKPESRTEMTELASAIAQAIRAGTQSTPRRFIELPFYSGAYQEWLAFKAAYVESVTTYTESENVARLRRCLKGKAREAVDSLLIYNVKSEDIMKALEIRFGRPDSIALAELERLRGLARPTDAPRELCVFASRVANVVATLQALKKVYYLFNPEITKLTIEKLTPALKYRWFDFATEQSPDEPDLVKLARFLDREANICSPYAQPETDRAIETTGSGRNNRNRTFTVNSERTEPKLTMKATCPICEVSSHTLIECRKFINAECNDRWDIAKKHRLCFKCLRFRARNHTCKQKQCEQDGCKYTHHKLLHFRRENREKADTLTESITSTWVPNSRRTFLKIIPVTAAGPKGEINTYALLDDGSTVTLVDEDVASAIGAQGPRDPLRIEAIANTKVQEIQSKRISLTLRGANDQVVQARTIKGLKLSPQTVSYADIKGCDHLIDLEKHIVHPNAKPRILIGQDNWQLLVASAMRTGSMSQPVASLTPLGWVLHGSRTRGLGQQVHYTNTVQTDDNMDEELRRYFATESLMITPKRPKSDPEEQALKILQAGTQQRADGYYETVLLWKDEKIEMPNNYQNALTRLRSTEKKIYKSELVKEKYVQQMENLTEKGYAEKAPLQKTANRTWYLPHFAVINPMKPEKLRVVHDAAAKTRGTSLNDQLLTGPDLLQSLPGVLMRFRQHRIAVSADIAEMFMQVKIVEKDRDALRYLWRSDHRDSTQPVEYRMTSLIFGATSSPATAIFVKNLNASKHEQKYPEAATAIVSNHYMDDYLQSFQSIEGAIKTAKEVKMIHAEAHFNLRQWTSNSTQVLEALEPGQSQTARQLDDGSKAERILGLMWNPTADELAFNLDMARLPQHLLKKGNPTKREMLKIVMSLFDPLGFASPVTTRAKQILQEVWRRGTGWDEPIPADLTPQWIDWMNHLEALKKVGIPRCYDSLSGATRLELHTFTDASESAYAAVLYWRVIRPDGSIATSLISAKARVAPLKVLSIPRLELQAAVMGSRMTEAAIEEHDMKPHEKFFWTDSRTVLTWLKTGARSYKPFVAHRIAAIEENSSLKEWRWVPTKMNVADDATRDVPPDLNRNHRWFCGPEFLRADSSTWPTDSPALIPTTGEERVQTATEATSKTSLSSALPDPERFSKYERLLRTTGRVLQFIENIRQKIERVEVKRTRRNKETDPDWRSKTPKSVTHKQKILRQTADKYQRLEPTMLRRAEELLVRASQEDTFSQDVKALSDGKEIANNSRLRPLAVELKNGIITLKSRIGAATGITERQRSPAVLDGNTVFVKLFIDKIHRNLHHAGVETTINECRQHFWILRLRPVVRMTIHRCLACRIRKTPAPQPPTGNHPSTRLAHHSRPFSYTGVDYFGPIIVTVGRTAPKRYVALFTCLTTRAVHLELASDLSTGAAVMALRRMIARRGCPTEIWSDNGTNLRGADKELREAIDSSTADEASTRGISWRYIPPGAPFMGGAWERLVRSVKTALATTLHERHPQEEVLRTLLAEVEFTVNSRPLTHVSVDPDDPEALTPNHFLLLGPALTPQLGPFTDADLITKSRWRASQRLADLFWARWLREYLPELQQRRDPHGRGPPITKGDVVLIADPNLPRNVWPRGLITSTYPGGDGIVRAVDVLTKGGILRRPTKKLILLQPSQSSYTSGVPATRH